MVQMMVLLLLTLVGKLFLSLEESLEREILLAVLFQLLLMLAPE